MAVLDFPEADVEGEEQNGAAEGAEKRGAGPEFWETDGKPGGDHADHERVEAIDDDHAQLLRPGHTRRKGHERSRDGGKSEEAECGGKKDGIESLRKF